MRIGDRSFREHVRLLAPLFGIIGAVWLLRLLTASLESIPAWIVHALSVSVFVPICIILATLLIHSTRFGGYASVVLAAFLLVTWSQILVVAAVIFSVLTGFENVYTAPEFSVPNDPYHTRHIFGHLTFVIGLESLIGAMMGCIILYMLRRTRPEDREESQR